MVKAWGLSLNSLGFNLPLPFIPLLAAGPVENCLIEFFLCKVEREERDVKEEILLFQGQPACVGGA